MHKVEGEGSDEGERKSCEGGGKDERETDSRENMKRGKKSEVK